jgi:hypothetical protein
MPYYVYWAHDAEGIEIHFIDYEFYDIGSKVEYKHKEVTIFDYAIEYDPSVF